MPRRTIYEGQYCFTTHVVHRHTPIFTRGHYQQLVCDALQHAREKRGLKIFGYVIMPDHLHMITSVPSQPELSDILSSFRRFTATRLTDMLQMDAVTWALKQLRTSESNLQLWENSYHPVDCSRADIFEQKLEYLHHNPVRAGFVRRAEDWRYSSAAAYLENEDMFGPPTLRIDFRRDQWVGED